MWFAHRDSHFTPQPTMSAEKMFIPSKTGLVVALSHTMKLLTQTKTFGLEYDSP